MFATLKEAREAGFRERKDWEYGGETTTVKNHSLVRNPKEALSMTQWSERGFRMRSDVVPHSIRSVYSGGRRSYAVYREDQVEPKRPITSVPPKAIDILAAVWSINRSAKRYRDSAGKHYSRGTHGFAAAAKRKKEELYRLKGQALHYLIAEPKLRNEGFHRFPNGNHAEVLKGGGYTFHRPCPTQTAANPIQISEIEAKPRASKDPRLKDALHTVKEYLSGKATVEVFQWPHPVRTRPMRSRNGGETRTIPSPMTTTRVATVIEDDLDRCGVGPTCS